MAILLLHELPVKCELYHMSVILSQRTDGLPLLWFAAVAWAKRTTAGMNILASGGEDKTVRIWHLNSDPLASVHIEHMQTLQGHTSTVSHLAWSGDGLLASAAGGSVLVHRVAAASTALVTDLQDGNDNVHSLSWSPDGQTLAVSAADATVRLWRGERSEVGEETFSMTEIAEDCQYLDWVTTRFGDRLACGRSSAEIAAHAPLDEGEEAPEDLYTYYTQFLVIDYAEQLELLKKLTYGRLTAADLTQLGLYDLDGFV